MLSRLRLRLRALLVGQVYEQIRLPLRRFSDGRSEIRPSSSPEHGLTQHPCAFTTGIIINLMNIGVADDQSKQRLGLRKDGCDLGSETPEKGFADRAGSVHGERDAPHSSGAGGALERQVDTFA